MTPDQSFARRVQAAIVLFVLLFAYFLAADLWMPITPQAQLTRPVLRIAPRVDGQVLDVAVTNNQHVAAGQLLFRLDPEPFRLAVRSAELALEQAEQDNLQLDAAIAAARAEQVAAQASASELQRETARLGRLVQSQHVSRQLYEQTEAQRQAAQAKLAAAAARIRELAAQRGASGDDNLRLRQARNALDQARLQLAYSEVRAERAGTLSNLQLSPGAFLHAGNPVAALVADDADISADFREKALRYVRLEDGASVVFDALPGHIFAAKVSAIDAGVKEGQLDANGDLAAPAVSDRWVRDAQRQRLHVSLIEALPYNLPSGAKATVQLYPRDSRLADLFGRLQIAVISLLHYVY
ncbi:HlyD family secretion protein [Pseudomonas resinovorans]|uniref:HlyD family secretion protein n=1 Tax=Metapseudomonas resinovorans TaxID=53412 RepID=UPI00237F3516|nr:HlyD family secretion protein [Pseudomonas resinovorans]MDE3737242.1 HlyD family secretion protein [Pseudomonas resinovorans]